jgi:hypothetical protein
VVSATAMSADLPEELCGYQRGLHDLSDLLAINSPDVCRLTCSGNLAERLIRVAAPRGASACANRIA